MSKNSKSSVQQPVKRSIQTTVGDLLAAAFEVAGGRTDATAELLSRGDFNRIVSGRRLRFI